MPVTLQSIALTNLKQKIFRSPWTLPKGSWLQYLFTPMQQKGCRKGCLGGAKLPAVRSLRRGKKEGHPVAGRPPIQNNRPISVTTEAKFGCSEHPKPRR